ncbi:alpha/beta hydrolase [Streptomyces sp. F-3]|nr:alpha/beta hydrolase [Streptomyces sp. F-3]
MTGVELIAHGMGGSVAIVVATRHPQLISRLVLADAGLDPIPPSPHLRCPRRSRQLKDSPLMAG